MLLPFQGYWKESITSLDREKMPRDEHPSLVVGSVPIRYDEISKTNSEYKSVVSTRKIEQIIEVSTNVGVKAYDYIYTDTWREVESVEYKVREDKKHVIRAFPNSAKKWTKKVVYLK